MRHIEFLEAEIAEVERLIAGTASRSGRVQAATA
jgi:hypothetical protein